MCLVSLHNFQTKGEIFQNRNLLFENSSSFSYLLKKNNIIGILLRNKLIKYQLIVFFHSTTIQEIREKHIQYLFIVDGTFSVILLYYFQNSMSERPTRSAGRSCETVASFLLKTYQILEHPQFEYMISWEKDGIGFVVKDVVGFTKEILPKYFRHANFSSFVRQLNMYDFHKVKQENDNLVFKNPLFRRGEQSQLKDIKRKASKKVFSHRRMPYERNHSQSQKYFSTLKALKKSVEAEINQSNLNFEKSLSLLKENSQSNKFKLKYIHELQESSVATPLDSLFMLKEECYRYFSKLEEWLTEVVDAETKKQQIIQNCMSQLQKNKEEKKSQQSFQSFPIITNPPFENYS